MSRQFQALRPLAPLVAVLALACCGGSSGPTAPSGSHTVVVVVFYDENGNGTWENTENARVPEVVVDVAGRTARSDKVFGRAVIDAVPEGTHPVAVRRESLPPFYQQVPGATVSVRSPQPEGENVFFPLTLAIGSNRPGVYMAFGDSITVGEGSRESDGYKDVLQAQLQGHFGRGVVVDEGISGTRSSAGAARIGDSLSRVRPAYSLILYGTNDWNHIDCKLNFPCFTIDSLRTIVRSVRAAQGLPVLGTIIPVNPEAESSSERNDWVVAMNELIRPLAQQEGAALADLHAAFLKAGDLSLLFADKVHPNDRGYQIIASEFFRALTAPTGLLGTSEEGAVQLSYPPSSPGSLGGNRDQDSEGDGTRYRFRRPPDGDRRH